MLTVTLVSLCSIAVYRVLAGGLKLWSYSQRSGIEEDINIFLDKFSEDLRNAFYFQSIPFKGSANSLTIATFVSVRPDERSLQQEEGRITQIGAATYYFDYENHLIRRSQANYSQALQGRSPDDKVLVRSVTGLKFIYYLPGAQGVEPYSKVEDVVPSAVFVEMTYSDGKSDHKVGRMVSIPVGV